jgi:hypothetical protein
MGRIYSFMRSNVRRRGFVLATIEYIDEYVVIHRVRCRSIRHEPSQSQRI